MANTQRVARTWSAPPESEVRRMKTMVEDEMMIKLGAKKETIEFHPLILAQKAERANTSFDLDYRRVKPPFKEALPVTRNPWGNTNIALRQMSDVSRQGPRKLQLPTVPQQRVVKRVYVPPEDEEFKALRLVRLLKRDAILAEWSALQHQAFTVKRLSHLSLPDIEPLRKYSSVSLYSLKSPTHQARDAGDSPKKVKKTVVPFTYVPPTGKPKSRWRGMARQVLWNSKAVQMRLPEEPCRSEIKIYVSCTQDLSEEREFLAEVAYPELRKFCEKQGLSCHVVDLRHGSSRLKNDRETMDVIQREIAKCRKCSIGPCFVSLVGQEADDSELPGWLSTEDMLDIRSVLVKGEDEVAVEALDNLYRLDSNYQPPIYLLQDSYFFTETEETATLHRVLPEVLTQLRQAGKMAQEPGYYSWSSTIQEIQAGLLSCDEPKRQTVCLMSRATNTKDNNNSVSRKRSPSDPTSSLPSEYTTLTGNDSADKLRAAIVDCYNRLGSKNNLILFSVGRKTMAYLREVCTLFLSAVTRLIERQINHHEFDISHHLTPAADAVQHVTIGRQTCANVLDGDSVVNGMWDKLRNPGHVRPFVILGPEGSGKTAVTSLVAATLPRLDPLRRVAFRMLGLTLSSSSLFHVLTSLYQQVSFIYDVDPSLPADLTLTGALQAFKELLHDVRDKTLQKGPLTVILDGLDKLRDMEPKHFSFLLGSFPQGITLVVSILNSGPLHQLVKTVTGVELVSCQPFSPELSGAYVTAFLSRRDRILTSDQFKAILGELSEENVPLVARIAAAMASRWPSHTLDDELDISCDMESAFHRLVEACEVQLGYRFTRYVLSLLVASRYGLAEFEILHIVASATDLIDEIKEEEAENLSVLEGYPYQLQLSRLVSRIEPFLYEVKTEGETILQVSHETLKQVVHERYMTDSFKYHVHARLATYFQFTRRGQLLSSRDIVEGKHKVLSHYLWRTLRSVPFHLCHSHHEPDQAWKNLKSAVFMKFSWVINEIYAGFFNDFMDDMNYALETLGLDPNILFLRQFMMSVRQAVIFNPVSLASLMAAQDVKEMEEIQKSVLEAQEWLKQVHLQVLVPTAYTAPRASQLLLNDGLAKSVKSVLTDSTEERVVLQYESALSSLDHRSGEETGLVSLSQVVVSCHLWGTTMLTVVTKASNGSLVFETYAVDKGRHVKSTTLQDTPVSWLTVRTDGMAYYASGSYIKKVHLEKGQVSEQCTTPEVIVDVCMSNQRHSKLVTLHTSPRTLLYFHDPRQSGSRHALSLQKAVITERCKPLAMTKDSAHVLVVCDRQLLIVDVNVERVMHTLEFNNLPVSLTAFSRSHEHVFVATPTGVVRCFKLNTGAKVMEAAVRKKQKPAPLLTVPKSPRGRNSVSPGRTRTPVSPTAKTRAGGQRGYAQQNEEESITTLVTSEDDHFLLAGTTLGQVYVLHVPTGVEVCVLSSGQSCLRQVVYFTNVSWFQSVATVDVTGWVKLWNLRPLITRARTFIRDIITDKDLSNEEEVKLDLGLYFTYFQQRRHDRMFLNGPDIASFYRQPPPEELFSDVQGMDPALQMPQSWTVTGRLADCTDVCAVSTGTDLSEILLTVTSQGDVARWSLQDGSLQALQPCPCPLEDEEVVEAIRTVYYDQALSLVVRQGNGRRKVVVQYSEEKKVPPLMLKDVITTHVNTSSSLMAHVCTGEQAELTLVYWNLVTGREQNRIVLSEDRALTKLASALTVSKDLRTCALLVPKGEEGFTLHIWTLKTVEADDPQADETEAGDQEETATDNRTDVASRRSERPSSHTSARSTSSSRSRMKEFEVKELHLQLQPMAVGFCVNQTLLLGTSLGLTLLVDMGTMRLTSALTAEGVEPVYNQPLSSDGAWTRMTAPHMPAVKRIDSGMDGSVVTVMCGTTLSVWNVQQKRLMVRVSTEGKEFLYYMLSRDCRVLTFVTSDGVLEVWGVSEKKQLCAFRLQTTITALAMTPDSRRIAVLMDDKLTSRIRVFDVRNIDDIRVDTGTKTRERTESIESRNPSVDEEGGD